jgi:hypothetical protein
MYRALVLFPTSAGAAEVDALIAGIASSFATSAGCQSVTRSVGGLMGPGAHAGEVGWILEADFASLEDVLASLQAESFQVIRTDTEALGTTIFLFEIAAA